MMKNPKEAPRFEERLEALEQLTAKMEEGQLGLEEMLSLYERGLQLAKGLKADLETAQSSLMELKEGSLKPLDTQ